MNISRTNYFPHLRDFNGLLDEFFKKQSDDPSSAATSSWLPAVDIKEEKQQFIVIADIPGVNKEDIHISLEHNLLTIQGERRFEQSESQADYSRKERVQGTFYRSFSLPQSADDAKITAKYKQGVLEISIPKKETAVQKRIDIISEE